MNAISEAQYEELGPSALAGLWVWRIIQWAVIIIATDCAILMLFKRDLLTDFIGSIQFAASVFFLAVLTEGVRIYLGIANRQKAGVVAGIIVPIAAVITYFLFGIFLPTLHALMLMLSLNSISQDINVLAEAKTHEVNWGWLTDFDFEQIQNGQLRNDHKYHRAHTGNRFVTYDGVEFLAEPTESGYRIFAYGTGKLACRALDIIGENSKGDAYLCKNGIASLQHTEPGTKL